MPLNANQTNKRVESDAQGETRILAQIIIEVLPLNSVQIVSNCVCRNLALKESSFNYTKFVAVFMHR